MTEERFDPGAGDDGRDSPWWGVHAARYVFAARRIHGARGLDVACGSGYGLRLLQRDGRMVVGADADVATAARARAAGVSFRVLVADGSRLPFPDRTFDFVTSFETLEHLHERDRFLDEIRRVLVPGGMCLLSTPNAHYTEPIAGKPRNPYHVHEYTPAELNAALRTRFSDVRLQGQILSRRFAVSPFWDDQRRLPRTLTAQSKLLVWRVLNRMPATVRDGASRALWGHQLIPSERDYEFVDDVTMAPVLLATCTRAATAVEESA
jgi:SAM-dependent methyltransferase